MDIFKNPKNDVVLDALTAVNSVVETWRSSPSEHRAIVNAFVDQGCRRALTKLTKDVGVLMQAKSDGKLTNDDLLPLTNRDIERSFGMLKCWMNRFLRMTQDNVSAIAIAKVNRLHDWFSALPTEKREKIVVSIREEKQKKN